MRGNPELTTLMVTESIDSGMLMWPEMGASTIGYTLNGHPEKLAGNPILMSKTRLHKGGSVRK